VKASPLAKKIAAERGVSLEGISGTGPGNRVVAKDVPAKGAAPAPAGSAAAAPKIEAKAAGEGDKTIPLSNMRRTIADRLVASKQQNPHFYLSIEVDAGALTRLRKELNASNEAAGLPKLTVNDFVLLAVGRAAAQHPYINASWGGDSIIQYGAVNISVAVAVDDGLITPVIRNADKLSLKEISAAVKDLAKRARERKLKPQEYMGGTFSISNLGMFGVRAFASVLNTPEGMILSVGEGSPRAVVRDGKIEIANVMTVTLTCDHRVVDGATGARWLQQFRHFVETPKTMLA
jgi:pyruvate dehydrogenase E2 component (dihydrolipoamide acetyltransferase)